MTISEEESSTKKKLIRQNKELLRMYGEIAGIAESGGKADVFNFLSEKFDSTAEIKGDFILIGSVMVQFDSGDNFLGMSNDANLLSVLSRKAPPHDL